MKILLISNIKENSGYSRAAESTLKSLYYNKIDVCARNITLTNTNRPLDNIVTKCLDSKADGADFLILHTLPSLFEYDGQFKKCIGKFDYETPLKPSNWKKKCELMDQVWVSGSDAKGSIKLNKPVYVIPHAVDVNRFERDFSKATGLVKRLKKLGDPYVFYTIGEFVPRKNYESLLKAWYLSFSQKDNVELVIKTSMPNTEPRQVEKTFAQLCKQIKEGLKLNARYLKDPIITADHFDDFALDTLHNEADCFVSTSHAEGYCLPALDSILFGNEAILPYHTGFCDYMTYYGVNGVVALRTPCYGAYGQAPDIYNGTSHWYEIDISHMIGNLKSCYNERKTGRKDQNLINKYSYASIGKEMINALLV